VQPPSESVAAFAETQRLVESTRRIWSLDVHTWKHPPVPLSQRYAPHDCSAPPPAGMVAVPSVEHAAPSAGLLVPASHA
jgi:hypothetical protein